MFKKLNKKGFTLAELLIVVAIIAVLVAISIPIFNSQLEKSREAVDMANIRAAYAEVMTAALTEDKTTATGIWNTTASAYQKTVTLKQSKDGWQSDVTDVKIGDFALTGTTPKATKTATVKYTPGTAANVNGTLAITFEA